MLGDKALTGEQQLKRLASVALANVWFENEGNRFRRPQSIDPWNNFDNFRVNHRAKREIVLIESEKEHKLRIEYLAENRFNVLKDVGTLGVEFETVLANAEVISNPEREGELLIRTDTEQFRLPYLLDENEVFCLD